MYMPDTSFTVSTQRFVDVPFNSVASRLAMFLLVASTFTSAVPNAAVDVMLLMVKGVELEAEIVPAKLSSELILKFSVALVGNANVSLSVAESLVTLSNVTVWPLEPFLNCTSPFMSIVETNVGVFW